jgi:4-amino-4-deoxy-L-arabinose transferase-like glycosyltransferase
MIDTMKKWLINHQRLVLVVILLFSVMLRCGYFVELNQSPCIRQHLWSQSDMNFFDLWAKDIATGDWLTDKALHPYHYWHQLVAIRYFRLNPEAAKSLAQKINSSGSDADPGRVLWNHWYGGKIFHQEPLYPYLLALTYKIFGTEVRWVFVWQLLLGVCSNILVYLIARRHFGVVVAVVAGLLAVFCSPMIYYDLILLRAGLIMFMGLLLVQVTDVALEQNSWPWWLLTSLTCGLAFLLKSTFLLFWLGIFGLISYRYWGNRWVLLRNAVILTLGLGISLLPLVARNVAVGVPVLSLQSIGPITFIMYNAEDFSVAGGSLFALKHAPHIMEQASSSLSTTIIETLRTHPSSWSYLRQLWEKFSLLWHWYEIPNNANFYYYRLYSPVLQYLPVTFYILAPLSIVGLLIAISRRIPCGPLFLAVFATLATLLLSFPLSRYRVELMALLIPFAALTVVQIATWLENRKKLTALFAISVLILVSWWTMRPLPLKSQLIRPADYIAALDIYYIPLEQAALREQDWQRGAEVLAMSLRYQPEVVQQMGPSHPPMTSPEARLASYYARLHQDYALALEMTGLEETALKEKRRAAELRQAISKE